MQLCPIDSRLELLYQWLAVCRIEFMIGGAARGAATVNWHRDTPKLVGYLIVPGQRKSSLVEECVKQIIEATRKILRGHINDKIILSTSAAGSSDGAHAICRIADSIFVGDADK